MRHKIRTQNDSSWECQAGTAKNLSKAKNTSAKAVERSSEKICVKQKGILIRPGERRRLWRGRGSYRRSFIQGGRRAHLLYLQNFSATSFSKKIFKHGRDSLQSILKPLFARPTRSIGQRLYPYIACENIRFSSLFADGETDVFAGYPHRVHDFHNIANSNINTSFDPLKFYNRCL